MNPLSLIALITALNIVSVVTKLSTAEYFYPKEDRPLILAHRGSSGLYPEHSMPSYRAAYKSGADFIEIDLVLSKDGVLFACHDIKFTSAICNVNELSKFADKKRDNSFYVNDFTISEVKELRLRQRYGNRPSIYDDQY